MPFRSFRPSPRRFPSSRPFRRRFTGARVLRRFGKYQSANFFFSHSAVPVAGAGERWQHDLLRIQDHTGDFSTSQGVYEAGKIRAIEVRAIQWSWWFYLNGSALPALSAHALGFMSLCYDRLDPSGVSGLIPDMTSTQAPVAQFEELDAIVGAEEAAWPTRILHTDSRLLATGANDIGVQQAAYAISKYARFKKRVLVDDDHGLFFNGQLVISGAGGTGEGYTSILHGRLWYRYVH